MTTAAALRMPAVVALVRWGVPLGVAAIAVIGVAAELAAASYPSPPAVGAFAAAVVVAVVLLARDRRPVLTSLVLLLVCLAYHLLGYPGQAPAIALFVAVFVVAVRGPARWALAIAIGVSAAWSLIPAIPPHAVSWFESSVLGPAIGMGAFAVVGALYSAAARQAAAERAAESAVLRARVARDIHDVLAHTLAAITVQTALALDAFDDDPELARTAMRRTRELARAATPQLRHSLLALRSDGTPSPPQPGLALVDDVLADAAAAGFRIQRRIDVPEDGLDAVVEMVVARVAQEAITNAVRHSGGGRLECSIAVEGSTVVLEVADDGVRAPGPEGLGIAGMRERVDAAGGTLHAGRSGDRGFRVRAAVPLAGPVVVR